MIFQGVAEVQEMRLGDRWIKAGKVHQCKGINFVESRDPTEVWEEETVVFVIFKVNAGSSEKDRL